MADVSHEVYSLQGCYAEMTDTVYYYSLDYGNIVQNFAKLNLLAAYVMSLFRWHHSIEDTNINIDEY